MILIPLGHEHTSVRRVPWVTFGLIGACVLTWLVFAFVVPDRTEEVGESIEEAMSYLIAHPYCEPQPEFRALLEESGAGEEIDDLLEFARSASMPPSDAELAEQQAELDARTGRVLEELDDTPYRRYGLVPAAPTLLGVIMHMFMHGGFFHLFGNMLILYLASPFLEDLWGRLVFGGLYLVAGLAAAGAHVAVDPSSMVPMVGASGAIAGVMGAFLICYHNTRIEFFYMIGFIRRGTFWAPAWLMLPLWLAEEVFFGLMTSGSGVSDGVAHWAHVGGFVVGAAIAFAIRASGFEERVLAPRLEAASAPKVIAEADPRIEEAQEARAAGNARGAWETLSAVLRDDPSQRDACLQIWDIALEQGWVAQGAPCLVQAIRLEAAKGEMDLAAEHWAELAEHGAPVAPDAKLLARLVPTLAEGRHFDAAKRAVHAIVAARAAGVTTTQLVRIAKIVKPFDAAIAGRAAALALERPDVHPSERDDVEALVRSCEGIQIA